jgi:hypothetical protein
MHDIYDPPPAPVAYGPPKAEPIPFTRADVLYLVGLFGVLSVVAASAWSIDPTLGPWVTVGGLFVILESWFSALTFLHRHPSEHTGGRWMIFVAALIPWLLGLGFATALMLGLFYVSDMNS